MSKRELIDEITRMNISAKPEFLAQFSTDDLLAYLHQLREIQRSLASDSILESLMVET